MINGGELNKILAVHILWKILKNLTLSYQEVEIKNIFFAAEFVKREILIKRGLSPPFSFRIFRFQDSPFLHLAYNNASIVPAPPLMSIIITGLNFHLRSISSVIKNMISANQSVCVNIV